MVLPWLFNGNQALAEDYAVVLVHKKILDLLSRDDITELVRRH
ncbi:MAG: hypothetical protein WBL63_26145 [Candidatus Acidiferrum sp.]